MFVALGHVFSLVAQGDYHGVLIAGKRPGEALDAAPASPVDPVARGMLACNSRHCTT